MAPEGATSSGSLYSDDGETVSPSLEASAVSAEGTEFGQTLDIPARPSVPRRASAGTGSVKTIAESGRTPDPTQDTAVFSVASQSRSAFALPVDNFTATIDSAVGHPDATVDDRTDAGQNGFEQTLPDLPSARISSGKAEPPEYEILGELGRGGMGVVYKARHRRLNRLVALKMIRGASADEIQIARFKIEAEAVATLRHPNILQIYDIGEHDGSPFVALELLEGGSLSDKLKGTTLPPKQAAEWMVPLVMAMDTAHKAGIVHRDLKSANVLFSADGIPKITDFGLAKRLEADEGQTHTGQVMGTPSYMAPEQARGDTKSAGPPADIYALGAMLYEMLTGRPPFKGVSALDTMKQVIERDPVSPSRIQYRVPRDLETVCLKCLQKEPRKRYTTAKEMAEDLSRYLRGEPIKGRRTPPIERAAKWVKRHPAQALASAVATVASCGLIVWGVYYTNLKRTLAFQAAQHLAAVKDDLNRELVVARGLVSSNDLPNGHEALMKVMTRLGSEKLSGLADLQEQTKQMLAEVELAQKAERAQNDQQAANEAVQKRYDTFLARRKEAIFRDTQFTGLSLPSSFDLTSKAAEDALGIFANRGPDEAWELTDLPASLSSEQHAEVKEGRHELLMILSEAVASQDKAQLPRALAILESSERSLSEHSRAYHLKKAYLLKLSDDRAGEARELASAQAARSETAFDFFLSGQQEYKLQPVFGRNPGLRKRTAKEILPLLGQMPDGHLRYQDQSVFRCQGAPGRLHHDRPRVRLALSSARLRQQYVRGPAVRRRSRVDGRVRIQPGRSRLHPGPRTTEARARSRAPVRALGQPRGQSIPAKTLRSGGRRLQRGDPNQKRLLCRLGWARPCLPKGREVRRGDRAV